MSTELLATCWTHAGDAVPVSGRRLSPLDLRGRAEAVAAATRDLPEGLAAVVTEQAMLDAAVGRADRDRSWRPGR